MAEIKKSPVISVIVPCHNHGQFLGEALSSVLSQTFQDWECIVIDNGSTDNTKEVAEKFSRTDERFIYFILEKKGVSAARNFGIKKSSGKYILPLDADDKIGKGYFTEGVRVLENNSAVKVVYCEAKLFGDENRKWELPEYSIENMLKENCIFCSGFFRRTGYDRTHGYNEQMNEGFEDWDFWLSLLAGGGDVFKIPAELFYYRIRRASRNNSLDTHIIRSLRKQIYENHKELYTRHLDTAGALSDWYFKKEQLKSIHSTFDYRLGKAIITPLRKLKSLFT